jgi:hypothetical protein
LSGGGQTHPPIAAKLDANGARPTMIRATQSPKRDQPPVIAAAMVGIVLLGRTKLARGVSLPWIFAGAGLFWLMILFGLGPTNYAMRRSPGIASSPVLRTGMIPPWQPRTGMNR